MTFGSRSGVTSESQAGSSGLQSAGFNMLGATPNPLKQRPLLLRLLCLPYPQEAGGTHKFARRGLKSTEIEIRLDEHGRSVVKVTRESGWPYNSWWFPPYPPAEMPFVVRQYLADYLMTGAGTAVKRLVDLGWEYAEVPLADLVRRRSGLYLIALAELCRHQSALAPHLIEDLIAEELKKVRPCSSSTM